MHRFLIFFIFFAATLLRGAEPRVEFNRDIRPILSDKCFFCHGPDPAHRDGKLRLDIREDAVKAEAIVPGDSAKSKLVERLFSSDPDDLMPPPKSKRVLTDAQKQTFKRWIEQGADYQIHWSFIPPKMPALTGAGGLSPIDELVAESLKKRGLAL